MLRAGICQSLFCQNVLRENSPKFNDVKVSRYTVEAMVLNYDPIILNYSHQNYAKCCLIVTLHNAC